MNHGSIITLFRDGEVVKTWKAVDKDSLLDVGVDMTQLVSPDPDEIDRCYVVAYGLRSKDYVTSDLEMFLATVLVFLTR